MRRALLVAVACCGFAAPALAKGPAVHVLTVQLPGGGVERIQYMGDVPPTIVVAPGVVSFGMPQMFGPNSPFAMMDRISAEMNREAADLIRQVESMAVMPLPGVGGLTAAAFGNLPPGVSGYSFVSTMGGDGVCMERTEITYSGNAAPRVVSSRSGDCGPAGGAAAMPARLQAVPRPVPAEAEPPGTIIASNNAVPASGLVHEADWPR